MALGGRFFSYRIELLRREKDGPTDTVASDGPSDGRSFGDTGQDRGMALESPACLELLDTERVYCSHLNMIVEHFLHPMRSLGIVPREDQQRIFSNIEQLHSIHDALQFDLSDESQHTLADVASAYEKMAPFFKAYAVYCLNYSGAVERLENLLRSATGSHLGVLEALLQDGERKSGQSLKSLLITPVQRLCKYPLLFREILQAAKSDPAHTALSRAADAVEVAALAVNERVREVEGMAAMRRLAAALSAEHLVSENPTRCLLHAVSCEVETEGNHHEIFSRAGTLWLCSDLLLLGGRKGCKELFLLAMAPLAHVTLTVVGLTCEGKQRLRLHINRRQVTEPSSPATSGATKSPLSPLLGADVDPHSACNNRNRDKDSLCSVRVDDGCGNASPRKRSAPSLPASAVRTAREHIQILTVADGHASRTLFETFYTLCERDRADRKAQARAQALRAKQDPALGELVRLRAERHANPSFTSARARNMSLSRRACVSGNGYAQAVAANACATPRRLTRISWLSSSVGSTGSSASRLIAVRSALPRLLSIAPSRTETLEARHTCVGRLLSGVVEDCEPVMAIQPMTADETVPQTLKCMASHAPAAAAEGPSDGEPNTSNAILSDPLLQSLVGAEPAPVCILRRSSSLSFLYSLAGLTPPPECAHECCVSASDALMTVPALSLPPQQTDTPSTGALPVALLFPCDREEGCKSHGQSAPRDAKHASCWQAHPHKPMQPASQQVRGRQRLHSRSTQRV